MRIPENMEKIYKKSLKSGEGWVSGLAGRINYYKMMKRPVLWQKRRRADSCLYLYILAGPEVAEKSHLLKRKKYVAFFGDYPVLNSWEKGI